jgi:diadenosine tetraphosphatase ApaH/serine/threonine PP2A family protein phosphatase
MQAEGVDHILQVGDLVGYGAEPGPCIDRIRELGCTVCRGNHDEAVIGQLDTTYFNYYARVAIEWTYHQITSDHIKYLTSLPYVVEHNLYTLVHGTLYMPQDYGYILSKVEAQQSLALQKTLISFVGHSHRPDFFYEETAPGTGTEMTLELLDLGKGEDRRTVHCRKLLVNVGSVGQPRDEDPRAAYAIYDSEQQWVAIRRVPYDVQATQDKIRRAGLPSVLADRLMLGL